RRDRLAQGRERELADRVVLALDLALSNERLLGEPDARDLRLAVRAPGDDRVIDRDRLVVLALVFAPRHPLNARDRFFRPDVRQPRRPDDITYGVYARQVGLVVDRLARRLARHVISHDVPAIDLEPQRRVA